MNKKIVRQFNNKYLCLLFSITLSIPNTLLSQTKVEMKDEWYKKSIAYEGDYSRIQKVFEKVEKTGSLTIGIIGGSITAGAAASDFGKTSWGPLLRDWFKQQYPDADIKFYNAGIGATNSVFGVHRVDNDLLRHNPDLVVVEYSVNDSHTVGTKVSYESLMRKILKSENKPAVLALGMMSSNGGNWQEYHIDICRNYRIPYISYRDAIYPEIKSDNMTWRDISPDEVHPNDRGHQIAANLITHFLENVRNSAKELPSPITLNTYENSYVYPFEPMDNKDWKLDRLGWTTSKRGKNLEFTINASKIYIMYNRIPDKEKTPTVYLTIDGVRKKLSTYFENGWGEYMHIDMILADKTAKDHKLIFEYDDSAGKRFVLHKILVTP